MGFRSMKTVSIASAKSQLSALIVAVESGQQVRITRRGKPVARLVPFAKQESFGWADLRKWVAGPSLSLPESN
ncbi:type II toxin-antitoxin system prevent-host-death family antitoxin [Sulfuritalea sp.]|uniref:type II toxin-antitoxin system Phd/YefM family antitoxin n=1 Tax=Sulfuritalea sp. TaxID=2480090 RepID=UPI00286DDE2B|nr:type II toxin-antitoxin system prevent-host-death family antitoxin [Sulfuritalea sp.]